MESLFGLLIVICVCGFFIVCSKLDKTINTVTDIKHMLLKQSGSNAETNKAYDEYKNEKGLYTHKTKKGT